MGNGLKIMQQDNNVGIISKKDDGIIGILELRDQGLE